MLRLHIRSVADIKVRVSLDGRGWCARRIESAFLLPPLLVLAHKAFDPMSIVLLDVGALLTKVSELVQEGNTVHQVLVDARYLILC